MSDLSTWGAFVVDFRLSSNVERGQMIGRVEHVVSGEVAHFHSLDELLAFVARVMETARGSTKD